MHKIDWITHHSSGVRLDIGWSKVFVTEATKIWIHKDNIFSVWLVSIVPDNDRTRRFEVASTDTVLKAACVVNSLLQMNRESRARSHH